MIVSELYSSSVTVTSFLQSSNIQSYLSSLHNGLTLLPTAKPEEAKSRLSHLMQVVDHIITLLLDFEADSGFPIDDSEFLRFVGLNDLFNVAYWRRVRSIIETKGTLPGLDKEVKQLSTSLQTSFKTIKQLSNTLGPLFSHENVPKNLYKRAPEEVLVTLDLGNAIQFRDVSAEVVELEKHLQLLARIDKNSAAKSFRILTMTKASPLHIELITFVGVGMALNKIVNGLLQNVSKVQDICKQQQEIKALKLNNSREELVLAQLKAEADDHKDPSRIVRDEVMKNIDENSLDGSKAEVEKAVLQVCKYFEKLLSSANKVTVHITAANKVLADESDEGSSQTALIEAKAKSNQLRHKIDKTQDTLGDGL